MTKSYYKYTLKEKIFRIFPGKKTLLKWLEYTIRFTGALCAIWLLLMGFIHMPAVLPGTVYEGVITGIGKTYDTRGLIVTRHARASVSYPADSPQGVAGIDLSWPVNGTQPAIGDPVNVTVLIDGRVMSSTGLEEMPHPAVFFLPGIALLFVSLVRITNHKESAVKK